jgi:hypothetical protein
MKKCVAPILLAILALSLVSAAGVVTTQKAAAANANSGSIVYHPGAWYVWFPKTYNMQWTWWDYNPPIQVHKETAMPGSGTASSMISTTGPYIESEAMQGEKMYLTLPSGYDWNTVSTKPCTVIVLASWNVRATGLGVTDWGIGPMVIYKGENYQFHVTNDRTTGSRLFITTNTVGKIFYMSPPLHQGWAGVDTDSYSTGGAGTASGSLTCLMIMVQFGR